MNLMQPCTIVVMKQLRLKDYLTIKEAAEYVGVDPATLRRWDMAGKLEPKRHPVNSYRLYKKVDLEKFLKRVK